MKKLLTGLAAGLFITCMVGLANATLIVTSTVDYDGAKRNLIYDDDLDITWLDYTKSDHEAPNWDSHVSWAENLSLTIGNVVYDNWRLPSAGSAPSSGYDQTNSEMGHLWYTELGNNGGSGLLNKGDFENLNTSVYWFGTEYTSDPVYAWSFDLGGGHQDFNLKNNLPQNGPFYSLAVRSGKVSPVPEPATMLLFGSGLAGLVAFKRKKTA